MDSWNAEQQLGCFDVMLCHDQCQAQLQHRRAILLPPGAYGENLKVRKRALTGADPMKDGFVVER